MEKVWDMLVLLVIIGDVDVIDVVREKVDVVLDDLQVICCIDLSLLLGVIILQLIFSVYSEQVIEVIVLIFNEIVDFVILGDKLEEMNVNYDNVISFVNQFIVVW